MILLAAVIRLVSMLSPFAAALLVGLGAVSASLYGLWASGRCHGRAWRSAWIALCLGLLSVVCAAVIQAVHAASNPANSADFLILSMGGGTLAVVGLTTLIWLRLPVRASEALTEAVVAASALAIVVTALWLIPSHAWNPGRDLPLLAAPGVDFVALWLTVCLISLTPEYPVGYRYLIGAMGCLFVAAIATCVLAVSGHSSWVPLNAIVLWGACLWAGALVHSSHRAPFEPVPVRSTRPSTAHVAVLLVSTLLVPAALLTRLLNTGSAREAGLAIAAVVLPLIVVFYLLHKVFAHAAAEYRAQHDPLTGICNRTLFEDRLKTSLSLAHRSASPVAVMYLDLDRFKSINDSLGHAVGNQVLQAVVKRLQGCLRAQDTFARMGGDEFTFLLPEIEDKDGCAGFAQRALAVFADPITIGGRQLTVQASAGIALYPDDGEDVDSLLKNADTAMYQAKRSGRNTFAVYNSAMSARARLRFALESSLRAVVQSDRLVVHYQPRFDVATGEISGAEALARWLHPQLGFIPPWAFIPLAEESTLVETLGEWVLETVCRQANRWDEDGLLQFPVAVNMSPRQFSRQSAVTMVSEVLDRTGFDPRRLEIEVTEGVLVEHMDDVTQTLRALRAKGIHCSIDDFGTGYSALTYLAEFPVDAIKIDRSFVSRTDADSSAASIVGAVIALAHCLDLDVVAEGVETDGQFRFLVDHGCDHVQGFLFSPALPGEEFAELVRSGKRFGFGFLSRDETPSSIPPPAVSEGRLYAVLDSMVQANSRPGEKFDLEAIESILAALRRDDLLTVQELRAFESLPARLALGALAGLSSVTSLSAAGVISPSVRDLAIHVLEASTGLTPPAPQGPAPALSLVAMTSRPSTDSGNEDLGAPTNGDQVLSGGSENGGGGNNPAAGSQGIAALTEGGSQGDTQSSGTQSGGAQGSGGTQSGGTQSGGTQRGGSQSGGTSGGTSGGAQGSGGTQATPGGTSLGGGTKGGGTRGGGTQGGGAQGSGGSQSGGTSGGTQSGGTQTTPGGISLGSGFQGGGTQGGGAQGGGDPQGGGGPQGGGAEGGGAQGGGTKSGGTKSSATRGGGTKSGATRGGGTKRGGTKSGGTSGGGGPQGGGSQGGGDPQGGGGPQGGVGPQGGSSQGGGDPQSGGQGFGDHGGQGSGWGGRGDGWNSQGNQGAGRGGQSSAGRGGQGGNAPGRNRP
ncbi:MAG TPA: EAL domain-containing protein [Acidimicrobiales bacterium]|nr:EAL domain-containing protein [Acidimicrobiales bacterium]